MNSSRKLERTMLKCLAHGAPGPRSLVRILGNMRILDGVSVRIDRTEKSVWLLFQCARESPSDADRQAATSRASDFMFTLVQLLAMLADLEKKQLLVCYQSRKMDDQVLALGSADLPASIIKIEVCDPRITELFADYLCKDIVPSSELHRLASKGLTVNRMERRSQGRGPMWVAAMLLFLMVAGGSYLGYQQQQAIITQMNAQSALAQTQGKLWSSGLEQILAAQAEYSAFQKETANHLARLNDVVGGIRQDLDQSLRASRRSAAKTSRSTESVRD